MSGIRVRLVFPDALVREPVLARLARRFPVEPNIRRATVEEHSGWIVCELDGAADRVAEAIAWMERIGVDVDRLEHPLES